MSDTDQPDGAGTTVLHFPDGIPGFPDEHRFTLTEMVEDSAFQLLDSVDSDAVSMVVTQPWLFFPDYAPVIDSTDQRELELDNDADAALFCSVSTEGEQGRIYINLRGPFVVNSRTRRARQVVLDNDDLPLRAAVELDVELDAG